jgi:hypothetical protein
MRELTYVARRTVEWREAPDPELQSDQEAIVAPVAATSCDVDSAILAGHGFIDPPFALGHECVARVVETGDAVTAVTPGDLVVVPWSINCGTCEHCRAGLTAHCTAVPHMAMYGAPIGGNWGGLFSDLVRVPWADAMLVPLPAGLDPVAMASASDNWSLSWRLVAPHLKNRPGARVLVVARGSIGLYVCDIARALGASDVLYVDPDPEHRELAETYGAPPPRRSNRSGTASTSPSRPPAASTSSPSPSSPLPRKASASPPATTSAPANCPCSTCTSPASPCASPATTSATTSPTPSTSPLRQGRPRPRRLPRPRLGTTPRRTAREAPQARLRPRRRLTASRPRPTTPRPRNLMNATDRIPGDGSPLSVTNCGPWVPESLRAILTAVIPQTAPAAGSDQRRWASRASTSAVLQGASTAGAMNRGWRSASGWAPVPYAALRRNQSWTRLGVRERPRQPARSARASRSRSGASTGRRPRRPSSARRTRLAGRPSGPRRRPSVPRRRGPGRTAAGWAPRSSEERALS